MLELFSLVNAKATQPVAFTSTAMYIMSVVALWVQYTLYLESLSKVALLSYSAERSANEVPQNSSKDRTTDDSSMFYSNTDANEICLEHLPFRGGLGPNGAEGTCSSTKREFPFLDRAGRPTGQKKGYQHPAIKTGRDRSITGLF